MYYITILRRRLIFVEIFSHFGLMFPLLSQAFLSKTKAFTGSVNVGYVKKSTIFSLSEPTKSFVDLKKTKCSELNGFFLFFLSVLHCSPAGLAVYCENFAFIDLQLWQFCFSHQKT